MQDTGLVYSNFGFRGRHRAESARTALVKGDELIRQSGRIHDDSLWDGSEWSVAEFLRREAKALMEGEAATTGK